MKTQEIKSAIGLILDWAERDQSECMSLDEESRTEARANLAMIEKVRPVLEAVPEVLKASRKLLECLRLQAEEMAAANIAFSPEFDALNNALRQASSIHPLPMKSRP